MAKKSQNQTPDLSEDKDSMQIDVDFDFKFYASPQAKQLLQWGGQVLKWLFPFLVAFSTLRSVGVEQIQSPQNSTPPPIEIQQSPKTDR
jgi:hypothetical protein